MKNGLLKKFLSFSYGSWSNLLLGLITAPVLTRIFSPEDLGKAAMFTLSLNILTLIAVFGTDQAFSRYYYDLFGSNKRTFLRKIFKIIIPILIVLLLLLVVFRKQLSLFLFNEIRPYLIIILIVALIVNVLFVYTRLIVRMQQKGNTFSLLIISRKVISFISIILLFYLYKREFEILIYGEVTSIFLVVIVLVFITRTYFERKKLPPIPIKSKEIISYSLPIALSTFMFWLFQSFDRFALKGFSSLDELGLYVGAFRLIGMLQAIVIAFSTYWVPLSYEKFQENSSNTDFYRKVFQVLSFLLFLLILLFISAKDLIILVLGSRFEAAKYLLPFTVFVPVMQTLSYVTSVGINFTKKTIWHLIVTGTSSILIISLSLLFIPLWGAKGAALTTGISYIFFFYIYTIITLRLFKVDYRLKLFTLQLVTLFGFAYIATFYQITWQMNCILCFCIFTFIVISNLSTIKLLKIFLRGQFA